MSCLTRRGALLCVALGALALGLAQPAAGQEAAPGMTDELVKGGFSLARDFAFLPDGTILVLEDVGYIQALGPNGQREVLNITDRVRIAFERGLLGIAVDPQFPARPYLFLHYTTSAGPFIRISRFTVENATDPSTLVVDRRSEVIFLGNLPDGNEAHNGGTLRFGLDGTLFISLGEDFNGCNAQDINVTAGKILRIQVGPGADPRNLSTLIPADNPFATHPNESARLVFATGLRNPFRFDVDARTGALVIGDVGENLWEEVSVARGGENFGWPYREANAEYYNGTCPGGRPPDSNLTAPAYSLRRGWAAAIVLSAVYYGVDYPNDSSLPPEYDGLALYCDYFTNELVALRPAIYASRWEIVPGLNDTAFAHMEQRCVSLRVGPDGAIYYLMAPFDRPSELRRISYHSVPLLVAGHLPEAELGDGYKTSLLAVTNSSGLAFTINAGAIPPGLELDEHGLLFGKANVTGLYQFSVRVVDPARPLVSEVRTFSIEVSCRRLSCPGDDPLVAWAVFAMVAVAPLAMLAGVSRWLDRPPR